MYLNLKAEMARKNVTLTELANMTGMKLGTLSVKINGKSDFTFSEASNIKKALKVDIPLDELFQRSA
jgi:DNA-binding Xre family transcriptional regulator